MAYSNWGAKVRLDGRPMYGNCDVTPEQVMAGKHYTHYLEHYLVGKKEEYRPNRVNEMYHAVVGDAKSTVLVCLYKYLCADIVVFVDGEPEPRVSCKSEGVQEISGVTIEWEQGENSIICRFADKLGRKWHGESGYMFGEGHEAWD